MKIFSCQIFPKLRYDNCSLYTKSLFNELWWSLFRILNRCEVMLYQQMGGHRDELSLHERSLDVLVGLLKEEIVSCVCVCACVRVCVCVCVCACMCNLL